MYGFSLKDQYLCLLYFMFTDNYFKQLFFAYFKQNEQFDYVLAKC